MIFHLFSHHFSPLCTFLSPFLATLHLGLQPVSGKGSFAQNFLNSQASQDHMGASSQGPAAGPHSQPLTQNLSLSMTPASQPLSQELTQVSRENTVVFHCNMTLTVTFRTCLMTAVCLRIPVSMVTLGVWPSAPSWTIPTPSPIPSSRCSEDCRGKVWGRG